MNISPVPRVRFKFIPVAAGMLLYACSTGADMLAVAVGYGNISSSGSNAVFVSYQKDAPALFNRKSLYELSIAYWSGPNYNTALSFGRTLRWKLSPENYCAATLGIGMVDRTTDHLGTTGQFMVRLAFGRKFGEYDLSIGETHYSNGKTALGLDWDGPNVGEDFLTLMLAREF
ncbi:acyloxyacyl hydrolase [Sulfuricaulis limicola]|uniref:acyloxyacyl hydrolase n=1 Tax=Sulfuricaulis limicola TaxID=1620215 RepID=UPI001557DD0D|nr:acyloxyacyl hydrolase [Sulfuricaulis limicola]